MYDVSRDGQRFLMLKALDSDQQVAPIVIMQNFGEELKHLAPPK